MNSLPQRYAGKLMHRSTRATTKGIFWVSAIGNFFVKEVTSQTSDSRIRMPHTLELDGGRLYEPRNLPDSRMGLNVPRMKPKNRNQFQVSCLQILDVAVDSDYSRSGKPILKETAIVNPCRAYVWGQGGYSQPRPRKQGVRHSNLDLGPRDAPRSRMSASGHGLQLIGGRSPPQGTNVV